MRISILIVTRKWNPEFQSFNYINELKHNNIDFEVLLAEGNNPSSQRNVLAKNAKGEFILFFDDDSLPIIGLLERYQNTLHVYPDTEILGGPSILIEKQNLIYRLSNIFFSSFFGIGPMRSRYNSFGLIRKATEKDLILCNMLIRRDFFLKTKGFDQNLYTGEENEFLKTIQANSNIIYDPKAIVFREPRDSFYLFLKQMFSYGKGRSKHLKLNYFFDYLFLIPLFFSLYVLGLPFIVNQSLISFIPVSLHIAFSVSTFICKKNEKLTMIQKILLPFFFFLGHFSYGVGLIVGIGKHKILKKFITTAPSKGKIQLHKLKKFKKSST
jgi:succinoglycan biosynthesis protein ExoA